MMPWLIFCATPQHLLTHNVTVNLLFFAIQRWNVANLQYAKIDLLLLFFAIPEGGGGNDMVDCFYFFNSATTPVPPINPQCNNQPVVICKNGLLLLFFAIPKGGRGE